MGHAGGFIRQHRAMSRLGLRRQDLVSSAALVVLFTAGWLWLARWVLLGWRQLFDLAQGWLSLPGEVTSKTHGPLPFVKLSVPFLRLEGPLPAGADLAGGALLTLAIVLASYLLPRTQLPFIYLLRALAVVNGSAVVYFLIAPGRFPYRLPDYIHAMLLTGLFLISMVPLILGFTYYIFDFSLRQKMALTAVVVAHLSAFVPSQYLLHAVVVYKFSMLYLPVLYLLFGLTVDVLVFVALYSWGMSWRSRFGDL
jgi:hypothetical protein